MAFPSSPSNGQVHSEGGIDYQYNSTYGVWDLKDPNQSPSAAEVLNAIKTVDGAGSGLDADLFDGLNSTQYMKFWNNGVLNSSSTTAGLISELQSRYGAFNNNAVSVKVQWSYSGSSDLVTGDSICGTIELAGCLVEAWGGTYKHIRITRPTTGTGGERVYVYNDQSSGYSPSWRMIWTSDSDGSGSGLDADKVDGYQASDFWRKAENVNAYSVGGKTADQLGGPSLGSGAIVRTNGTAISENITIPSGTNGMSAGPISINSGYTVTVNGDWTVV